MPVEGRGLGSRSAYRKWREPGRLAMSLRTPEKVRKLQEALHAKAKESPDFRFYALYDKVYRKDVLEFAYRRCRQNGGRREWTASGSRTSRRMGWSGGSENGRKNSERKTYRPQAVLRVWIPKPDGSQAAARYSNGEGPCRADGGCVGLGADLRGRSSARAVRLPAGSQRIGGRSSRPWAAESRGTRRSWTRT